MESDLDRYECTNHRKEVTLLSYRPNKNSKGKRRCSEGTDVLFKAKRETCVRNPNEELKILSV